MWRASLIITLEEWLAFSHVFIDSRRRLYRMTIDNEQEKRKSQEIPKEDTAGQTLKKIFRQGDGIPRVQEQPASVSMLMNPSRLFIFLHLFDNPCDHTRSIARKVGGSLTGTNWNLGQLSEKGYIKSSKVDVRRLYWPAGMLDPGDAPAIRFIGMPWCINIISTIRGSEGGARQHEITKAVGESQQNTEARLRKLEYVGLLESSGEGRARRYRIGTRAIHLSATYESRAQEYSRNVWNLLRNDGLMPGKRRFRGTKLSAEVMLPSGKRRIYLECNPMAPVTRLLGKEE